MKQTLLYILFFFVANGMVVAQNFTFMPEAPFATADLNDTSTSPGDVPAHAEVVNNAGGTVTYVWEKTIISAPPEWGFGMCDINTCYFPTVDSKEFILPNNGISIMDLHAYPGGEPGVLDGAVPGTGVVEVKVYRFGFADDAIIRTYTFEIDGTVSTTEIVEENIKLYPNPVSDFFSLDNDSEVAKIQVYNVVGKQMMEYTTKQNQYDISQLPRGLYLVRLINDDNEAIKTVRMTKKLP